MDREALEEIEGGENILYEKVLLIIDKERKKGWQGGVHLWGRQKIDGSRGSLKDQPRLLGEFQGHLRKTRRTAAEE